MVLCKWANIAYSGFGWIDFGSKGNHLVLGRNHRSDLLLISEFQARNAFETLLEMWLHSQWIFGFGQNFQQFIVGQEEKP